MIRRWFVPVVTVVFPAVIMLATCGGNECESAPANPREEQTVVAAAFLADDEDEGGNFRQRDDDGDDDECEDD